MMDETATFKHGDVVIHVARPEWGDGRVGQATTINHGGRPAQRLVIDFAHRGRVTLNTAVAQLVPKTTECSMSSTGSSTVIGRGQNGGWLESITPTSSDQDTLIVLPEAMTDPFLTEAKRLRTTLDSFRFSTEARSLIDWAVSQTSLSDPLSHYTRHELEQAFARFTRDRDKLLFELVRMLKRQGRIDVLNDAKKHIRQPQAKIALQKAMRA